MGNYEIIAEDEVLFDRIK